MTTLFRAAIYRERPVNTVAAGGEMRAQGAIARPVPAIIVIVGEWERSRAALGRRQQASPRAELSQGHPPGRGAHQRSFDRIGRAGVYASIERRTRRSVPSEPTVANPISCSSASAVRLSALSIDSIVLIPSARA